MPKTNTQIKLKLSWTTHYRRNLLDDELTYELEKYFYKTFKELKCPLMNIEFSKHKVDCEILLNPTKTVSEIIRWIKGGSSHYVNFHRLTPKYFSWQKGYRAISMH